MKLSAEKQIFVSLEMIILAYKMNKHRSLSSLKRVDT